MNEIPCVIVFSHSKTQAYILHSERLTNYRSNTTITVTTTNSVGKTEALRKVRGELSTQGQSWPQNPDCLSFKAGIKHSAPTVRQGQEHSHRDHSNFFLNLSFQGLPWSLIHVTEH